MRWTTYRAAGDASQADRVGLVVGDQIYGLKSESRLIDLLSDDGSKLRQAGQKAKEDPREVISLGDVRILPPIPEPRSIRDFSSFLDHWRAGIAALGQKFNEKVLELPIFYYTCNTNMTGNGDEISIPGNCEHMDYELEICCIIGKPGIDLSPAEAESHIAGYTIMNDWSARDILGDELRRAPMPAKGKDAGMGLGPFLVTPDEIEDRRDGKGFNLAMKAYVNGKEYSNSNWNTTSWSFGEVISYASRNVWLRPGDVISLGTVGTGCILELGYTHGHDRFPWLKPGDEVTLEIERIGRMTNTLKAGRKPHPIQPLKANAGVTA